VSQIGSSTREAPGGSEAGLESRRAALAVVETAIDHRGGLEEALAAPAFARLELRERGFARALAMTALRRRGALDRVLGARLAKPPPEPVLSLLRLGAAQLLFMDTASHAAVSTTVTLAGEYRAARPFKGLVNAVLRAITREGPPEVPPEASAPDWLFARWRAAYGDDAARTIAGMIPEEPPTDLTLRDPAEAAELAGLLDAEILPGGTLRTRRRGEVSEWPGYDEGRWWVQDASAAVPARLLQAKPGQDAVDLCAAPGGKAMQLAAAGARLLALDRSSARLERVRQNLGRTGLKAEIVAADAGAWGDKRQFDAVLLDAPCTATGTFRRHPDVLWTTRPSDIAKLAQTQARLLEAAAERVRPGGRLVYCVCSLEPEEGEGQLEAFLAARGDFSLEAIMPEEGGAPAESLTLDGILRILPQHRPGGTDGFFIARLTRLPRRLAGTRGRG
jgi:16S rRNA (cytosine967-C5)-methyltransferase